MVEQKITIREKEFSIKKFTVEQVADLLPLLKELALPEIFSEAAITAFALQNIKILAKIFSEVYGENEQWYKDMDVFEMVQLVTAVCGANLEAVKNFKGTLNAMGALQKQIIEVASAFGSASQSSSNPDTAEPSNTP